MFTFKNTRNSLLNLGTKQGTMLVFLPHEEKVLPDEVRALFASELENHVSNHLLSLTHTLKNVVTESQPLKKGKKIVAE